MKERKRRGIVLLRESRFSESVSGGSGEFAVAVVVQHFLEVCASAREAIEISIAFAQRKISVRPAGKPRIIIEIFLIFRDRQIVKLARKKRVGVSSWRRSGASVSGACRRSEKSSAGGRG